MIITRMINALFWKRGILIPAEAYHQPFSPVLRGSDTAAKNCATGADGAVYAKPSRLAGLMNISLNIIPEKGKSE